jgi:proteic killer suppression protein
MIRSFRDQAAEDIFNGRDSKPARRRCSRGLWKIVARKLEQLDSADDLQDLRVPPGNRLEALSGDRAGQFSIRINVRYRICFTWTGLGSADLEIVDYH